MARNILRSARLGHSRRKRLYATHAAEGPKPPQPQPTRPPVSALRGPYRKGVSRASCRSSRTVARPPSIACCNQWFVWRAPRVGPERASMDGGSLPGLGDATAAGDDRCDRSPIDRVFAVAALTQTRTRTCAYKCTHARPHTRARTHTQQQHDYARARTHARTHTRTHARTHTYIIYTHVRAHGTKARALVTILRLRRRRDIHSGLVRPCACLPPRCML